MEMTSIFNGNKLSVLSAAIMIEQDHELTPVLIDQGCSSTISNLLELLESIDEEYGTLFAGNSIACRPCNTAKVYMSRGWKMSPAEMGEVFPGVLPIHLHHMAIKTAEFVHAIAICKAKGATKLCDYTMRDPTRYSSTINFMVIIDKLCEAYGIELHTPLFNVEPDEVDGKLYDRSLLETNFIKIPSMFDVPNTEEVTAEEAQSYQKYFEMVLLPKVKLDIADLIPMYKAK